MQPLLILDWIAKSNQGTGPVLPGIIYTLISQKGRRKRPLRHSPVRSMDLTRKKMIGPSERLDQITEACGDVWSDTVRWFWRSYDKGTWLSKYTMMRWMCTRTISTEKKSNSFDHPDMQCFSGKRENSMATAKGKLNVAQNTAQTVVEDFYDAMRAWKQQDDPKANPPSSLKSHHKATWNYTQITLREDEVLELQTPRGEDPVTINWPHPEPKRVEIGWQEEEWEPGVEYEVRVQFEVEPDREPIGDKTIGIDLGEKHLAAATDGEQTWLVNGGEVRSLRRYQNKLKAILQSKIDTKEPGSRRWQRLVTSKDKQLRSLRNQIRDVLHKLSRRLVETLFKAGASTLVFGDIRDIRDDLDHGTKQNQRMHQWVFGRFRRMTKYKARLAGMEVADDIDEAYTSQTCPSCGHRKKPSGREYRCPECKARFHRDEAGAYNIRKKYLDGDKWQDGYLSSPVVADQGFTAVSSETPEETEARSSPRGGKSNQLGLFASGQPDSHESVAPSTTREAPCKRVTKHPTGIRYSPHMDCGPRGSPVISSQG